MDALPSQLDPAETLDDQHTNSTSDSAHEPTGRCRRCERPILVGEIVYLEVDQSMQHTPVCPGGRP